MVEREEVRARVKKIESRGDGESPSESPGGEGDVRGVHKTLAEDPESSGLLCRSCGYMFMYFFRVGVDKERQAGDFFHVLSESGCSEIIKRSAVEVW